MIFSWVVTGGISQYLVVLGSIITICVRVALEAIATSLFYDIIHFPDSNNLIVCLECNFSTGRNLPFFSHLPRFS